ncbi:hypothetical protein GCM10009678_74190 [Actinomadura kijaniata]|uniref:Uncharacterized protein n=1 Tax=Actinomadura namibiensis TaxID=182080 RepID=A0A7W3LS10_ACTNM|nr:hypothetical protein [Actinomadura namibiensis]MBA8953162.1 hypothetical protein [Actinomadura namibiensis]
MRTGDVVVVQGDEFGDPDAGVEQQPTDGAVAGEGAAFDGAQVPLLLAGVQGAGRELGCVVAAHHGRAEAELGEEVVQGGEVGVDSVRGAVKDGLHVGLVVADGEVAVVGVGERGAIQAAAVEPGEEGPHAEVVGAPGVAIQRSPLQRRGVGGVDRGERLGYRLVLPSHTALAISEVVSPG